MDNVTSPTGWDKGVDSTFSDPLWRKAFRPVPFGTSPILARNRPVSQEVPNFGKKFVFFRHTAPSPSHRIERYDVTRALAEFDADEMHR